MKIVVGLGNPGREYEYTKHNVGFLTVDILAEKLGIGVNKIKYKALTGEGLLNGEKIILVKPQTYMNLSGNSVREVVNFYKTEPEDLIVIYDDADIPLGSLRLRRKGSAGTHNGMKSIIYDLGYDDFPRVRIGIGSEHGGSLADFVLSGFGSGDVKTIEDSIVRAADSVICIVEKGIQQAMTEFNTVRKKTGREEQEQEKQRV